MASKSSKPERALRDFWYKAAVHFYNEHAIMLVYEAMRMAIYRNQPRIPLLTPKNLRDFMAPWLGKLARGNPEIDLNKQTKIAIDMLFEVMRESANQIGVKGTLDISWSQSNNAFEVRFLPEN